MVYADVLDGQIAERCSPLAQHRITPDQAIDEFNEALGIRAPVRARAAKMRSFGMMGGESVAVRSG
jgi:hypothetical protein